MNNQASPFSDFIPINSIAKETADKSKLNRLIEMGKRAARITEISDYGFFLESVNVGFSPGQTHGQVVFTMGLPTMICEQKNRKIFAELLSMAERTTFVVSDDRKHLFVFFSVLNVLKQPAVPIDN